MRLPRKRKKQVKKLVAAKTAIKITMSAMTSAQAMAQTAVIAAIPSFGVAGPADKALKIASVLVDTKNSIMRIMSEPPNSWKDFIVSRETQKPSS